MTPSTKYQERIPKKPELLRLITRHSNGIDEHQINRIFNIDAKNGNKLKIRLNKLIDEGLITLNREGLYINSAALPRVTIIEVTGIDQNGDVVSKPLHWRANRNPPLIYVKPSTRLLSAPGPGDHLLARLTRLDGATYDAEIIKKLHENPSTVLGIFSHDNVIIPVVRENKFKYKVAPHDRLNAQWGELVIAKIISSQKNLEKNAKIIECLGKEDNARNYSHIAMHLHEVPFKFSEAALRQAAAIHLVPLEGRTDLRSLPLVTIDGENARDFDDAIFAEPWKETNNGWHIIVSLADVAWYVRPETPLDVEAKKRGNSVYFPDRVVPMLPENLSNGWCSLVPNKDRASLVVHIWIDKIGNIIRHKFERAVIRSHAQLTYTQVQLARDGFPDAQTDKLMEFVINPLFSAYESLIQARQRREPLELNVPEVDMSLDDSGNILGIVERPNLDSHRLIEEFMIAANIVAALTLESNKKTFLYRVHHEPSKEKLYGFREYIDNLSIQFPTGKIVKPSHFNRALETAVKLDALRATNDAILRAQSKAYYTKENYGHFGLALNSYCHFTSPIRRYADLLVHRALISALKIGDGGFQTNPKELEMTGSHLSHTEQRAVQAERDAKDRISADYFSKRIGDQITGIISGVTKFGLFVNLDGFASGGFIPIRSLPNETLTFNKKKRLLKGRRTGIFFRVGDKVRILIEDTNPINRTILLKLYDYPKTKQ